METETKPQQQLPPPSPKHGQGLRALVETRQRQLEAELVERKKAPSGDGANIEAALAALKALLTGNLDQIPPVLAQQLAQWIETSKYLGANAVPAAPNQGQGLRALVEARHRELEAARIKKAATLHNAEIESAANALKALLTGDLDRLTPEVADELSRWIDISK